LHDCKERLTAPCGDGAPSDFAEAAGLHVTHLSKQIAKGGVDPTLAAHLEWREAIPVVNWPPRWAALAARARAKAGKDAKAA